MEMGCAVISGNLPLLRPYFEPFFRIRGNTIFTKSTGSSQPSKNNFTGNLSHVRSQTGRVTKRDSEGFEYISDDGTLGGVKTGHGSDVELCDRQIVVKTDLTVTTESIRDAEERRKKHTGW